METPLLDELASRVKYSTLHRWIISELGEEPIEFSTVNPDQSGIMAEYRKLKMYSDSHATEDGLYYHVMKCMNYDKNIRTIVHYIPDENGVATDTIVWLRPSDLEKIVDTPTLVNFLLKEF